MSGRDSNGGSKFENEYPSTTVPQYLTSGKKLEGLMAPVLFLMECVGVVLVLVLVPVLVLVLVLVPVLIPVLVLE